MTHATKLARGRILDEPTVGSVGIDPSIPSNAARRHRTGIDHSLDCGKCEFDHKVEGRVLRQGG
jgi:hypothetical protein